MRRAADRGAIAYLLGCQGKCKVWQAINVCLVLDQLLEGLGGILHQHMKELCPSAETEG